MTTDLEARLLTDMAAHLRAELGEPFGCVVNRKEFLARINEALAVREAADALRGRGADGGLVEEAREHVAATCALIAKHTISEEMPNRLDIALEPFETCNDPAAELTLLRARETEAREVVGFYVEHAAGCRLIHSGGDVHRNALDRDGGARGRAFLSEPSPSGLDTGGARNAALDEAKAAIAAYVRTPEIANSDGFLGWGDWFAARVMVVIDGLKIPPPYSGGEPGQ